MSPRATSILALVALALGAFVYVYEIEGEVDRQAARDEEKKIHTGFAPEDVDVIALRTLDGVDARFERQDGRWRVTAPVPGRADALSLDAMANALANLPREGTVDSAADLAGFGLGDDAETIRFEAKGTSRGLRLGRDTPVGGHRYVARLADDAIAYVAGHRVNAFKRNLDDLRDRRIFTFESGDVDDLQLGWDGDDARVALAKDAAGTWRLRAPLEAPADEATVRDLLSDLVYLRAGGFVDDRAAVDPAALAETAISFRWTVSGSDVERTARVAGAIGDDRLFEGPEGGLYTIPGERLEDFPRQLVAYRFKRLADFDLSAARRLELEFPEGGEAADGVMRVIATLEETGWTSADRHLDADRTTELVRALSSLTADDLFADEMGPAELASLGLDPPRAKLRVEGSQAGDAGTTTLASLHFGRADPDRGRFVMRADASTVFLLGNEAAAALPTSAAQWQAEFEATPDAPDDEASPETPAGELGRLESLDAP